MSTATATDAITKEEVLECVNELHKSHDEWVNDGSSNPIPPESFDICMRKFDEMGMLPDGTPRQFPMDLGFIRLTNAMFELLARWTDYIQGEMRPDESPTKSFWDQFRKVMDLREAELQNNSQGRHHVQSIAENRSIGLSDYQIAMQYGKKTPDGAWYGPFFDENQRVNTDLIKKEEVKPGSVIGSDWVHPADQAAEDDRKRQLQNEFRELKPRVDQYWRSNSAPTETIEGLLLEGAFPKQIAKATHSTEEEVYRVAAELGITPNTPNTDSWTPPEPTETAASIPQGEPHNYTSEDIAQMVSDAKESRPDANSQDIADAINSETGLSLSRQKVTRILKG